MKRFVNTRKKKQASLLLLTSAVVVSNTLPSIGSIVQTNSGEQTIDFTSQKDIHTSTTTGSMIQVETTTGGAITVDPTVTPEQDTTYTYDFRVKESITPSDTSTIQTAYTQDGLVEINGNGSMKYHGTQHGLAVANGNTFNVKVAGNAIITFDVCAYGNNATLTPTTSVTGNFSKKSIPLQASVDGSKVSVNYVGEPGILTFTVNGSGYLHAMEVENTSENIDIKEWKRKDFSIDIGDVKLSLNGAESADGKATGNVDSGQVYYANSQNAYVSIDLKNKKLTDEVLINNSEGVVERLEIDEKGDILVTFTDQETYPATYTIKIQDRSQFEEPTITSVYSFDLTKEAGLVELGITNPINHEFRTNNGILNISKATSTKSPFWKDGSHGLYVYTGNTIEIDVAGDAEVSFAGCQYSKDGGVVTVNALPEGGVGAFEGDKNSLKTATCGEVITYKYTGPATTLVFDLTSTLEGNKAVESYIHSITVKNQGKLVGSPVVNEQKAMPSIMGNESAFAITPVGHRLIFGQNDGGAALSPLKNESYYVFDATTESYTLEADIKISAIGGSSSKGIYVGLFDDQDKISSIATIGIRGDKKIRNMYNKSSDASKPSAGSIDKYYTVGDVIHVVVKKTADGFYSEFSTKDDAANSTIKYSATSWLKDVDTLARFGFVFADVNGTITNLKLTDEAGTVLYDQTDAYEAIGKAPIVDTVNKPVISEDRTEMTVTWEGEVPKDDAAYKVELSKDGGENYTTLGTQVIEKTYTIALEESGDYVFRITGVCGSETSGAVLSPVVKVLAPLDNPVLKAESGDRIITLNWSAVENATAYEIYKKSSEEEVYQLLDTVETFTYTDTAVVNEEPYNYYIVAKSETNESNPSNVILTVPSAGREGKYVYEKEATDIFITRKSYDTVYKNQVTLEGRVDKKGTLCLEVNGKMEEEVRLNKNETFAFAAELVEGRNDVNLLFTDEQGKVTRKTFNFVYLTNYDIVVDSSYAGVEGAIAEDGTGAKVYTTVQQAVDSVSSSNTERVVILIKEGSYREHLVISSPNITLIGEDREKVNLNFYDPTESPAGGNTDKRCAIYVKSSATGFAAENLTMENTYTYLGDGTISNESADALRVDADQATFVNVKLLGYQDTLQANTNKQYFYKSYIAGNVDFIYGTNGQTLFEDCEIVYRYNGNKNSGYITAPKTDLSKAYGYIFNNCIVYAEEGCSGSKYLLGRPWGPDGAATFINTYMGGIVNKTLPYSDMSGNLFTNARFSEYYSYGDGYAINSNRPQISKAQADAMLMPSFLGWNPQTVATAVGTKDFVGSVVTEGDEKFIETEYTTDKADPDATDDTGLGAFSVEGYAEGVTGGGTLLETSQNYYKVSNGREFVEAIANIKKLGKPSVIELLEDISLGSKEIGDAITKYSSIIKPVNNQPLLHPTLLETGVSTLYLKDMSNLTIYSKNGSALEHVCVDISNSSNIIIRNVVFDELWEWDEATGGDYDRNDWDYMTIQNGSTDVWIDHCTFYKAYDGIVDIKKATADAKSNVTISWSKFLPEAESTFFDEMMDLLEANPEAYPYYNKLLTEYGMTKEQVRAYAAAQKKTHLVGASDTEANMENLQLTIANNYYKNSMDRMPRMRSGNSHVYNTIMDASDLLTLRDSITNPAAAMKVVSNGAISTCNASVLLENTYINGIINALASGNGASAGGYINAVDSAYYMNGELTDLKVTDNAGAGMILDRDEFVSTLPYTNYNLYNVNELHKKVLPRVGASTIEMSSVQWQKTSYNDAVGGEDVVVTYDVSLDYQGGSSDEGADTIKVVLGEAYGTLPVPVKEGHTFLGWYTTSEGGVQITDTTMVIEEKAHTLYARWQKNDDETEDAVKCMVSFDYQGGTADHKVEQMEVTVGEAYGTLPLPRRSGYTFAGWYTSVIGGKRVMSDTVVTEEENHTLYARWTAVSSDDDEPSTGGGTTTKPTEPEEIKPEETKPEEPVFKVDDFTDVAEEHWAKESIAYVLDKGILQGVSEESFAPNETMTRAMFATVLYRLADEPEQIGENKFNDVKADAWYEKGILWANSLGIINGMGEGNFKPGEGVTREQMATMLYNFMRAMDLEVGEATTEVNFADQENISPWAAEGMKMMVQAGVLVGDDKNNCNPKAQATRAEVSAMLHRFMVMMEK